MDKIWEDMLYPDRQVKYPDSETWQTWRDRIQTRLGGLSAGFRSEMLLRGYKMIEDMTGNISFIQGWTLAITGKLPDKNQDRLLNAMFINATLTDPRFWMFRTARLASTVKSTPAACMAAGLFTNDAEIFSAGPAYNTSVFLQTAVNKIELENASLEAMVNEKLARKEIITGFGRVLARGPDERNPALLKVAAKCGLDQGKHLKLAFEIERVLQKNKNADLYMNGGGLRCALLSDLGFNPHQVAMFYSLMHIIGMAGNVTEAYERPPGEFLPLQKEDIEYTGPGRRTLPAPSDDQTVVYQDTDGRIVVMDSISFIKPANRGDVIVCGSHGGIPAAQHSLAFKPRGIIFNDAGKGKHDAGIQGLYLLENSDIPAATADVFSACIGDGMDSYDHGLISAVNSKALKLGITLKMTVKDTALKML